MIGCHSAKILPASETLARLPGSLGMLPGTLGILPVKLGA